MISICGFTVLRTQFSAEGGDGHYLYVKEHSVRDTAACKPCDRTLFVLNVPPYVTESCLQQVFSSCGKVQNVYLHNKPTSAAPVTNSSQLFPVVTPVEGFKVAYVVFKHSSSVSKAKKLSFDEIRILSTPERPLLTGIKKWSKEYQVARPHTEKMQEEIDMFMADFDKKQDDVKRKAKDMEGVADEDGWVTVTRHGKTKATPRTEANEAKVSAREKKKSKNKELLNFYAFQMRESKREHIAKLRQKFQEDKQKIETMKASRKFKPY